MVCEITAWDGKIAYLFYSVVEYVEIMNTFGFLSQIMNVIELAVRACGERSMYCICYLPLNKSTPIIIHGLGKV